MRVVVFDIETGGFDEKKHAITQFAAIAIDLAAEKWEALGELEIKIKFLVENANPEALEKNSYDEATWEREAIMPHAACLKISKFLKRFADVKMTSKRTGKPYQVAQMCGHNADRFDMPFLIEWYKKLDEFCPAGFAAWDTCQLARWKYATRPQEEWPRDFKLETLCEFYGIRIGTEEGVGAHDALADVRANVELLKRLL